MLNSASWGRNRSWNTTPRWVPIYSLMQGCLDWYIKLGPALACVWPVAHVLCLQQIWRSKIIRQTCLCTTIRYCSVGRMDMSNLNLHLATSGYQHHVWHVAHTNVIQEMRDKAPCWAPITMYLLYSWLDRQVKLGLALAHARAVSCPHHVRYVEHTNVTQKHVGWVKCLIFSRTVDLRCCYLVLYWWLIANDL